MVPFLTNEPSIGQQGLSNIRIQNHSLPQGRSNRNCQICGDMASGFNLNVPRYVSEVLETFFREGSRTLFNLRFLFNFIKLQCMPIIFSTSRSE